MNPVSDARNPLPQLSRRMQSALVKVEAESDPDARTRAICDAFERATARVGPRSDAFAAVDLARTTANACRDLENRGRIYETAMRALSSGVSNAGGFLGGLALEIFRSISADKQARGASSLLRALRPHVDEQDLSKAAVSMVGGAVPEQRMALAEAAEKVVPSAGFALQAAAACRTPEAAVEVAAQALGTGGRETVLSVLKRVTADNAGARVVAPSTVEFYRSVFDQLSDEPWARVVRAGIGRATFGESVQGLAEQGLELLEGRRAGTSAEAAAACRALLARCVDGQDTSGQLHMDRANVTRAILARLEECFPAEARPYLELLEEVSASVRFGETIGVHADLTFRSLEAEPPTRSGLLRLAAAMVGKASVNTSVQGEFIDDKYDTAQACARLLLASDSPWERLVTAALQERKYAQSTEAIARVGFERIARDAPADDRSLAQTAAAMLEGAVDAEDTAGQFRSDKVALMRVLWPVLEELLRERHDVLAMTTASIEGTRYAPTASRAAHRALSAIAAGTEPALRQSVPLAGPAEADSRIAAGTEPSLRQFVPLAAEADSRIAAGTEPSLRQLAAGFVDDACTEVEDGVFHNDKGRVLDNCMAWLRENEEDTNIREVARLYRSMLAGVTFADTVNATFQALMRQAPTQGSLDAPVIVRIGEEALAGAARGKPLGGSREKDDRRVVARNLSRTLLRSRPNDEVRNLLSRMFVAAASGADDAEGRRRIGHAALEMLAAEASPAIDAVVDLGVSLAAMPESDTDRAGVAHAVLETLTEATPDPAVRVAMEQFDDMASALKTPLQQEAICKGIRRWASADAPPSLWTLAEPVLADTEPWALVQMLYAWLPRLAAQKGGPEASRIEGALSVLRTLDLDTQATRLKDLFRELADRRTEMERMADAVNKGTQAGAVVQEADYVVIGGLRVPRAQKAQPEAQEVSAASALTPAA